MPTYTNFNMLDSLTSEPSDMPPPLNVDPKTYWQEVWGDTFARRSFLSMSLSFIFLLLIVSVCYGCYVHTIKVWNRLDEYEQKEREESVKLPEFLIV